MGPSFWLISTIISVVGCFWFLLFSLLSPTVYPNPGLAAYTPPPMTRLVLLPRTGDLPEMIPEPAIPSYPPSASAAFAQAEPDQEQTKEAAPPAQKRPRAVSQKRPRAISHDSGEHAFGYAPSFGYARPRDYQYRWWTNRPRQTGNQKSWF
jgi:hypothetical protein